MPVLKPVRGIRLNKSHPLARGLVGYWLLNEGSGNKVFDLSGNGNTGTFVGDTHFVPGKFGSALDFDGTGDYVGCGTNPSIKPTGAMTIAFWAKGMSGNANITGVGTLGASGSRGFVVGPDDGDRFMMLIASSATTIQSVEDDGSFSTDGTQWEHYVGVYQPSAYLRIYWNGVLVGEKTTSIPASQYQANGIGVRLGDRGDGSSHLQGLIDHVKIWNRALSASEIALDYREPFCMFDRASNVARLSSLVAPQIVELAGTSAALSSLSAIAKVSRKVGGTIVGTSNVDGSLGIMGESPPEMERSWLTEALFNGMTANAFKLGTSLSLGWFWVRVTGCSVLYRGAGMGEIDFANILAVSERDVSEISPPSYISHNNGSTYFYVVRRFNNCGYQELTLAAAVKVSIKSNGELAEPQPNDISSSNLEQVAGNKVRLTWFYCPLEQGSIPVSFNVYYDDRTGQIDYQNPLFSSSYKGRKFYSFQSPDLSGEAGEDGGGYLFAIRAEDASGIESRRAGIARLKIQLDTLNPDAIDILRAEAV